MIKQIVYIIVLLPLFSCVSTSGDNSLSENNADNYRYGYTKSSDVKYHFNQERPVRYNKNNYSPTLFSQTTSSKYKNISGYYTPLDNEDQSYSEDRYSLYNKPNNYTGYYKVGQPYEVMGKKYCPMPAEEDYKEEGVASWYGEKFYGRKTANGETYNMHDLTAAHRTLPLPSIIRVTNLDNGKSIKVRVNDRGPFAKDRVIDVSKEAAKKLGFINNGTTNVKIEYLSDETDKMLHNFGLK